MSLWNPGPPAHPDEYRIVVGGQLMPKTFVPQLVRMLERACRYIQKHHATLATTLTTAQMSNLDLIVSTCNLTFGSYDPNQQP